MPQITALHRLPQHVPGQGDAIRSQNDVDELQEQNKWLEWSQFTALITKLRSDWDDDTRLQRWPPLRSPTIATPIICTICLLLGLYSCIPGRGAEVRLLQYIPEKDIVGQWQPQQQMTMKRWADKQKINLITRVYRPGAGSEARTETRRGRRCLEDVRVAVQELPLARRDAELTESNFSWWTALFESYLETYRPLLVSSSSPKKKKQNDEHNFVFVTRHGTPFAANYFSDFLSTLLFRHTGQRVATNILRSSFVTHFYSSDEAQDPVMRESVATVMRNSVDQALRVYDRRSTASKKHKGLQLLASRQQQHRLQSLHPTSTTWTASLQGSGNEKNASRRPTSSSSASLIRSSVRWRKRTVTACCTSAR